MPDTRRDIPPTPPRWQPSDDPETIVVPGLDTEASTIEQIEQVEQLITFKLQNIDENFSRIHSVLSSKLLPAVKRYAVGTEPVRDAAKFWTSFYEQAAQIRIERSDDLGDETEQEGTEVGDEDAGETTSGQTSKFPDETMQTTARTIHDASVVTSETSFMPTQAAFSSTPAMARHDLGPGGMGNITEDPSWSASMESPLVRLDRQIKSFSLHQDVTPSLPASAQDSHSQDDSILDGDDGDVTAKHISQSSFKVPLRHRVYEPSAISSGNVSSVSASPLKSKGKGKTPVFKKLNPYLPADVTPADWTGVVDLRDTSVAASKAPRRAGAPKTPPRTAQGGDESFDGLPPGMSPPVMISPAKRFAKEPKLGRTPTKEASTRIKKDLLRATQIKNAQRVEQEVKRYELKGKTTPRRPTIPAMIDPSETSSSTIPSPPAYTKYGTSDTSRSMSSARDSTLDSMVMPMEREIQRHRAGTPDSLGPSDDTTGTDGSFVHHDYTAQPLSQRPSRGRDSMDSDSDSLDMEEFNNTAHPSAAFLMASQGRPYEDDDSFDSNRSSDSLEDEDVPEGVALHPFAQQIVEDNGFDDEDDDSFEGEGGFQEETLFGVPPAQRQALARPLGGNLRMLGEDLLEDTIFGIAEQRGVEETPTPWGR